MLPCIFECVCVRMHVWALAEVCVVVAGSIEREDGSSGLWAVSCGCSARPQTADKYQASPPLNGPLTLPSFQISSLFHFLSFLPSYFSSVRNFPLFLPSTRGSPWQYSGAGDRKWVSGSAEATGSDWLRSGCNLTPVTPTELQQHTPDKITNYRFSAWDQFN